MCEHHRLVHRDRCNPLSFDCNGFTLLVFVGILPAYSQGNPQGTQKVKLVLRHVFRGALRGLRGPNRGVAARALTSLSWFHGNRDASSCGWDSVDAHSQAQKSVLTKPSGWRFGIR